MSPVVDNEYKYKQEKWKVDKAFDVDYDYVYENALKDDAELRKNVKRVLEVIIELLKDRAIIEENARRDAKNAEHKVRIEKLEKNSVDISAENVEFKAELVKLRHNFDSSNLTRPQQPQHVTNMQNSCSVEEEKILAPSEKEMMVSFLDEVNKKIVSDGIRQRKRDKKFAKVEPISSEKGKQVSVNKKALRRKEQREKFIQEVSKNSSTKCSNTIALIQERSEIASEKQVDLESNAISRILNMKPKDTLLSDEKNSELSHPNLSLESNKKNSELSHTNTLEEQTSLKSGVNILPNLVVKILIINETLCSLCKLDHDDDESIEDNMTKSDKILTPEYLDWHAKLSGLPSVLTDKVHSNLYKKYKKETGHEPWQLSEAVIMSAKPQASDFKPITYKAKPYPELIIESILEHFTYLKL
ncbi:hypothetical protein C1646_764872 [Rhizophagus diaphanus]|nr:hypothetical protein C1646_764872 [Rhizophagus diaphanus] [Rhizophagus sp. MUCL 43196]